MLDWTDRNCRFFLRQISQHTLLYTEMITTGALLHRDPALFLDFDAQEHPLALQLGGNDPTDLAHCTRLADQWGYDEINLNVGCPSDRVKNGRFGACLMAEPDLLGDCISAMREVTERPVTVKHRIGIDDRDSYEELTHFVDTLAKAGCEVFIVHARKAWLQGLSPKDNRGIPPLNYAQVHRLKADFPHLQFVINGGLKTLDESLEQLQILDGVMIGREAYHNPWMLAEADQRIFGQEPKVTDRRQVIEAMLPFIDKQLAAGIPLNRITRHILGLFQGQTGARAWRRELSENAVKKGAGLEVVTKALSHIQPNTDRRVMADS